MLSGANFGRYLNTLDVSQGGNPRYTEEQINSFGQGTNWMDAILRTGSIWNNQLTISGGSDKSRYAVIGNYLDNQGIIINTNFKRYGLRLNLDNDLFDGKATLSNGPSETMCQRTAAALGELLSPPSALIQRYRCMTPTEIITIRCMTDASPLILLPKLKKVLTKTQQTDFSEPERDA
jgi:hypothetical protein